MSTGYRNLVLNEAGDLLKHQSLMMHKVLMGIIAGYSILFSIMDFTFKEPEEACITLSVLPGVIISFILFYNGRIYISKLFNVLQTMAAITALSVFTGTDSLVFMYFFPIIIGSFVLFQGKEIVTAYVLAVFAFLLLLFITYSDIVWGHMVEEEYNLQMDQIMNIVGVSIITTSQVFYMTRVSSRIQHRLVANMKVLDIRNEQLMSTVYTRDRMMSVISHDLRSPVATLDTAADILVGGELDPVVQKTFLKQFKVKTSTLLILIDQLLDWSRAQTNTIRMNKEDLPIEDLNKYLRNLSELLSFDKKIAIEIDFVGAENAVINCDRHMIEGVFRNLLSNAVKFSEKGSSVKVYSRLVANGREFVIEDHGKGMTQEQIDNLLQKVSFTTEGTLKEVGHGFGLQLVHEFLEKHNSKLKVTSTLGKGSVFSFVL